MLPEQVGNILSGTLTVVIGTDPRTANELREGKIISLRHRRFERARGEEGVPIRECARQPTLVHVWHAALATPRLHLVLKAIDSEVPAAGGRFYRKPVCKRCLRRRDHEATTILPRLNDRTQQPRVGARVTRDVVLVECIQEILQAIVPVRKGVEDIASQKFRRCVTKIAPVVTNPDHEVGITKLTLHYLAQRELLLYARLSNVFREYDDLLHRLFPGDARDLD